MGTGGKDTGPELGDLGQLSLSLSFLISKVGLFTLSLVRTKWRHVACSARGLLAQSGCSQRCPATRTQRAGLPPPRGPGLPAIPTDRLQEGPSGGQDGNLRVQPSVPQAAELGSGSEAGFSAPLPRRTGSAHPPSVATSSMLTLCSWAMYPRMEKMANPETKLVTQLMVLVSRASLGGGKNPC